jgi:hypothetical protein
MAMLRLGLRHPSGEKGDSLSQLTVSKLLRSREHLKYLLVLFGESEHHAHR